MKTKNLLIVVVILCLFILAGCGGPSTEMYVGAYKADTRAVMTIGSDFNESWDSTDEDLTIVTGNNADLLVNIGDGCILPADLEKESFKIQSNSPCTIKVDGGVVQLQFNGDGIIDSRDRLSLELTSTGTLNMDNGASLPATLRLTITARRL
ncbi:MAG: hypothetical protein ACNA8W_07065 [Bradymonadaceae bacterium]